MVQVVAKAFWERCLQSSLAKPLLVRGVAKTILVQGMAKTSFQQGRFKGPLIEDVAKINKKCV